MPPGEVLPGEASPGEVAPTTGDAAALAGGLLAEEARRIEAQEVTRQEVVLPDDLLPGVGDARMSLADGLRAGGALTVVALGFARMVDFFDNTALAILAPDIQRSLGASDAVMGAIAGAFGILFLLGSVPLSTLADRYPRKRIAAASMSLWSVMVLLTGQVQNAFWLFMARLGTGISSAYALPVNAPLLVDAYPIAARTRVYALYHSLELSGRVTAPLFVGGVAGLVAGDESWRWVFAGAALLGLPAVVGLASIREPRRGRNEMRAVLGEELAEGGELPISLSVAFERLRKVRTFHFFLLGFASLGFALISIPLFLNLYLEDELGLSAWERGLFGAAIAAPGVVAVALAGRHADALFRRSPPTTLAFVGTLLAAFGVFVVVGLQMPHVVPLGAFLAVGLALSHAALACSVAVTASVVPYRLRSRGVALIGVYIFLFGGFFGSVITGVLSDALGERGALSLVVLPATLIGGALVSYGARHVRRDISLCVEELLEEKAEADRMRRDGAESPAIQVRNLDFSYGNVQVLFDIDLDVRRGETLALLGTNGAGKSTLLRVISGLGVASRGVVRLYGRTITYCDPELRAKLGIVQLMGGNAVFSSLDVTDNLRMAGYLYDGADLQRRIEAALSHFPALAERHRAKAYELSGGQQQQLALAMALVHEPEVLIIDELSLGLAPIVLRELVEIVASLRRRGLTMIVVEQSLNVALSIADRAVFMEKGRILFDGPAAELAARDDLARAVFLGGTA